jgi:hypothetical protein
MPVLFSSIFVLLRAPHLKFVWGTVYLNIKLRNTLNGGKCKIREMTVTHIKKFALAYNKTLASHLKYEFLDINNVNTPSYT